MFSLAACATAQDENRSKESLLNGEWQGEISWVRLSEDNYPKSGIRKVLLAVCNGEASIRMKEDDGKYSKAISLEVRSSNEMHVLSFLRHQQSDDPSWVESQTWTIIELDSDNLQIQWSRAIRNRHLELLDPLRTIHFQGMGRMERTSRECEPELVRPIG